MFFNTRHKPMYFIRMIFSKRAFENAATRFINGAKSHDSGWRRIFKSRVGKVFFDQFEKYLGYEVLIHKCSTEICFG